jgi:hypothetical protein
MRQIAEAVLRVGENDEWPTSNGDNKRGERQDNVAIRRVRETRVMSAWEALSVFARFVRPPAQPTAV